MVKKIIHLILAFLFLEVLCAQNHDYNWLLGRVSGNSQINFNYTPPQIENNNLSVNFSYCVGSCSDSTGNLLFFTNGLHIYNQLNQVMENGDTINPGVVWLNTQSSGYASVPPFSLPKPSAEGIYYMFHCGTENSDSTSYLKYLYYSVIDMNANNGLGKVLEKNVVLMEGDIMWPASVKHGNGRDWWIMGLQQGDTNHHLFLLSPEGISGPYIQDFGPAFDAVEYAGKSLFSQDGNLFVRHDSNVALRLYDFDRCSGTLSNVRLIPQPLIELPSWVATFSSDDRFLYLSRPGWVTSFDLQEENFEVTYDTVAMWELNFCPFYPFPSSYLYSQLGPDGKIYFSNAASTRCLNVIHHPSLPGDAVDCEEAGISLPGYNYFGLPQFPNYRLGKWQSSSCDTLNFQGDNDRFYTTVFPSDPSISSNNSRRGYTLLPPLPGISCSDCSKEDLASLRNPMQMVYALMKLQTTGSLPDNWPTKQAEREGIYLALPPRNK